MILTLEPGIALQDRSCRIRHRAWSADLPSPWRGGLWRLSTALTLSFDSLESCERRPWRSGAVSASAHGLRTAILCGAWRVGGIGVGLHGGGLGADPHDGNGVAGGMIDAFALLQYGEAAAFTDKESAASATGAAQNWQATALKDRGRGVPPIPTFKTCTACRQR